MTQDIKFGFKDGDKVTLYEFCSDPAGSRLQWYKPTDKVEVLEGRTEVGHMILKMEGKCSDTAEYHSRLGELAKALVTYAPEGTTLVALVSDCSVGTRTFSEKLTDHFYQ